MATKLKAAHIATSAGADMVIANGNDFHVIHKIMQGRNHGTLFLADKKEEFYLDDIIDKLGQNEINVLTEKFGEHRYKEAEEFS